MHKTFAKQGVYEYTSLYAMNGPIIHSQLFTVYLLCIIHPQTSDSSTGRVVLWVEDSKIEILWALLDTKVYQEALEIRRQTVAVQSGKKKGLARGVDKNPLFQTTASSLNEREVASTGWTTLDSKSLFNLTWASSSPWVSWPPCTRCYSRSM